ncbi:MAG: TIGR02300 family protein [Rhizobiaceae bacterium]|nr:TIGR02300 family protein [Rhizobiaceae bacterium]
MAKTQLGTKRIDPETGRKFYDLNKDPIVSPYTGISYPRSYFDSGAVSAAVDEEEEETEAKEVDAEDGVEVVSLEEADDEAEGGDDAADIGDDDDVDLGDDDDDTFLEEEEDEDEDVGGMVGGVDDDEEV